MLILPFTLRVSSPRSKTQGPCIKWQCSALITPLCRRHNRRTFDRRWPALPDASRGLCRLPAPWDRYPRQARHIPGNPNHLRRKIVPRIISVNVASIVLRITLA